MDGTTSMSVILVEDNEDLNALIKAEVQAAGFHCEGFHCFKDWKDSGCKAEVYVLDLNLPDIDGISLARKIREDEPSARIVMLTARIGVENRIAGYEAGASAYLQKPCTAREIVAAITANMPDAAYDRKLHSLERNENKVGPRTTTENEQSVPSLVLRGRILRGDFGSVSVSPAEQDLLTALSASPDGCSYETLISLFSAEKSISLPTLEVRITRLRKKIETILGHKDSIRSVRKFGYCLLVPIRIE